LRLECNYENEDFNLKPDMHRQRSTDCFDTSDQQQHDHFDADMVAELVSSSGHSAQSTNTSDTEDDDEELRDLDYSTSNIYNYENDDEGHYNRYESDMDFSTGFKMNSTDQVYVNVTSPAARDPVGSHLLKSVNSMSSLISNHGSSVTKTTPTGKLHQQLADNRGTHQLSDVRQKYNTLNAQRLALVDLLLEFDADKYLVAKLSTAAYQALSKKSQNVLKKWYEVPSRYPIHKRLCNVDLRPFSPLMVSLCLDDVEIFSRLHRHHRTLFRYFKPNEDFELIYHAVRFQSENCLIYLLSNLGSRSGVDENDCFLSNDLSVQTMFYILENTRSPKIISVLIKCGFDLTRCDELTGNTALHCLFNEANTTCFDRCLAKSNGEKILR